ncbi:MAG: TM2 domain-containing protein [Actinobacteria bacterium]|nr:TM2 domain-containing protein [Actinomycetota bacterium]
MTTGSNKQQWLVQIPGQPDSPVDTFTLSAWAKTKVIQPETQVTDVETNRTFAASQIPGVFSDKEYIIALLFSIFLGYLGIDRFYMGQVGMGIGKLLTGGGCGVWWLIDVILIATRSSNDAAGRPLK